MAKLSELIDNNNGPISYDTAKEYNVWSRPKARIISEKYTKYKPLQIWLDDPRMGRGRWRSKQAI